MSPTRNANSPVLSAARTAWKRGKPRAVICGKRPSRRKVGIKTPRNGKSRTFEFKGKRIRTGQREEADSSKNCSHYF